MKKEKTNGDGVTYSQWKASLKEVLEEEGGVSIGDVQVEEKVAKSYWKDGLSARQFFREHIAENGVDASCAPDGEYTDSAATDFDFKREVDNG